MTCIVCGCTDTMPCIDETTGETCAWFQSDDGPMCSFCVEEAGFDTEELGTGAPLVETFSEYEADAFLRARRASA